jgi:hypothetical protein
MLLPDCEDVLIPMLLDTLADEVVFGFAIPRAATVVVRAA